MKETKMKKAICLLLVLIMVMSLSGFTASAEITKDVESADKNPYGSKTFNLDNITQLGAFIREKERLCDEYYQAKINENIELTAKLLLQMKYLESAATGLTAAQKSKVEPFSMAEAKAAAAGISGAITMYWEQQINGYYCGVATARMIIWRKKSCPHRVCLAARNT